MKVVILMPLAEQRGGGELMLWQLMKHGHRPDTDWLTVFFEKGPLVAEFRSLGVDTRIIEVGRLRQVARFVQSVNEIAALLRQEEADLVLSWSAKPHLYGSLAGLLAGVPSTWYQLGYPVGVHLSWLDRIATLLPARGIITLSRAGSEGQARLWPRRPTHLVYPGVELDRFDPQTLDAPSVLRKHLGLPEQGPLIGIVGRLQRWKGMHVLIEAMPTVLQTYPEAHCVIVGGLHAQEPNYAEELEARIGALGLEQRVTMVGFQDNVPEWMQAMDIVVHASDNEPFGIVVIEAMALGKPIVAGDAAGPSEIITPGVDGLLAPYDDAAKLADQVLYLLDHPEQRRAVGEAAQARARMFAPEHYADNLISALRQLVEERATVQMEMEGGS